MEVLDAALLVLLSILAYIAYKSRPKGGLRRPVKAEPAPEKPAADYSGFDEAYAKVKEATSNLERMVVSDFSSAGMQKANEMCFKASYSTPAASELKAILNGKEESSQKLTAALSERTAAVSSFQASFGRIGQGNMPSAGKVAEYLKAADMKYQSGLAAIGEWVALMKALAADLSKPGEVSFSDKRSSLQDQITDHFDGADRYNQLADEEVAKFRPKRSSA